MSLDTLSCRGTVCLQRQLVLSIFACIYTPYALSHYIGYRQRAAATRPRGASTAPRPPPLLPPQRPCPPGFALPPLVPSTHAAHASGDRGRLARQQRSRSCTANANQLQLQCTTKTARARRSPSAGLPCALARTLPRRPRRGPREPQRPPLHSTPLAQDLQRHPTPAPQLPARCTLPQHSTRAYGCD